MLTPGPKYYKSKKCWMVRMNVWSHHNCHRMLILALRSRPIFYVPICNEATENSRKMYWKVENVF
jgi:hypothetical protein